MILNDRQIAELCVIRSEGTTFGGDPKSTDNPGEGQPMISPYVDHKVPRSETTPQTPIISFGQSSFGYDIRLGGQFKIFTTSAIHPAEPIDPRNFKSELLHEVDAYADGSGICVLPPYSFTLAESLECFDIPSNVMAICVGKSTYARCGIIVNVTPIEPGWRGILTLEIHNTTPRPAVLYPGQGIAQLLFFAGKTPNCSYKGRYQDQKGIQLP